MLSSYDPTIILFGIYPSELKTDVYTRTCTWTFIEALRVIAKTWSNKGVLQ